MDETVKPLRIPPQISVYAEKHEIFDLVQTMVSSLIIDQPEEPISYLISLLKRDRVDVPKIIILGAPASGKTTIATKLCCQLGVVHVTTDSLLREAGLQNTHTQQDVPDDVWLRLIQQRLNTPHCFRQGWLLEGIPQSRLQALSLQENGIIPQHVVVLEAPDDVLLERSQGRMLDPVTGDVYHRTFIWPSDQSVAERLEKGRGQSEEKRLVELQQYRCEVTGLISTYRHALKAVNADQPHTDVYQQVLNFVLTPGRSVAPIIPRILLLGPPGSGKSHQATLLSDKYNMVNVSCGQLLKSVAADDSRLGGLVKPYIDTEQKVPDSLVLQILTERLSRLDCCTRGWVLHDFPKDLQQAEKLNQSNYIPSRVFFLEMTDDVTMERLTLRTTDPVSGERYHSVCHPAPPEVQDRLQTSPKDTPDVVRDRLTDYWTYTAPLKSLYVDAVSVNADQEPHTVFESLESRLLDRQTSSTRVQRS